MGPNETKFFQNNPGFKENAWIRNNISYTSKTLFKRQEYGCYLNKAELESILSQMNHEQDLIAIERNYDSSSETEEFEIYTELFDSQSFELYQKEEERIKPEKEMHEKLYNLLYKARREDRELYDKELRHKQYLALKKEFEGNK